MKKAVLLFLLIAAGGVLFAQIPAQVTTISGTLGLSAGRIAVKSGGVTYYTGRLGRLVGFIDGLKDGAQVTMEGYVSPSVEGQAERYFSPAKLTVNGKTYEVGPSADLSMRPGDPLACGGYSRHGGYSGYGSRSGGYGSGSGRHGRAGYGRGPQGRW